MVRLVRIEVDSAPRLIDGDECYHIGEYQARGGYQAGETNQLIANLKIPVPVPQNRQRYKNGAIITCGDMLARALNHDFLRRNVTLVPVPGSKPIGHREYDDRLVRVCQQLSARVEGGVEVRSAVTTTTPRQAQHLSDARPTVEELLATMQLDPSVGSSRLKSTVLVVDDVFTTGTTFRAMRTLLGQAPGVERVVGVSIARTVWPDVFDDF